MLRTLVGAIIAPRFNSASGDAMDVLVYEAEAGASLDLAASWSLTAANDNVPVYFSRRWTPRLV